MCWIKPINKNSTFISLQMKAQDNLLHGKASVLQVMKFKNKLCLELLYFMHTFTYTP